MTKLLAFVFWDVRRFFKFMYDDGFADLKALAVIVCTEILGIMAIASMISIIVGYRILPTSKSLFVILGSGVSVGVTAVNYYLLRYQNKWTRFEAEFSRYSARSRMIGHLAVIAAIIAVLAATAISLGLASHLPR